MLDASAVGFPSAGIKANAQHITCLYCARAWECQRASTGARRGWTRLCGVYGASAAVQILGAVSACFRLDIPSCMEVFPTVQSCTSVHEKARWFD